MAHIDDMNRNIGMNSNIRNIVNLDRYLVNVFLLCGLQISSAHALNEKIILNPILSVRFLVLAPQPI